MTIPVKLSEKDFVSASFAIIGARKSVKLFLGVFVFIILFNIVMGFINNGFSAESVLPGVIVFGFFGVVYYFGMKRSFKANKRLAETITYTFNNDALQVAGESFTSTMSWDKIYKVTVGKKWLLIWQNKQTANAIPVNAVPANGLDIIKNILTKHQVPFNF